MNNKAGTDAGELNTITNEGTTSFGFDDAGNRICLGTASPYSGSSTNAYTFNATGELTGFTVSGGDVVAMTYDGNSELEKEVQTLPGMCPTVIVGERRHATQRPRPTKLAALVHRIRALQRADDRRGGVHPDTLNQCVYTEHLTWNTALGSPTLAVTDTSNPAYGGDMGHTDYIMGPDGQPVAQVFEGSTQTPEYYYQDFQGNTRVLVDGSGNVDTTYNYPSYGVVEGSSEPAPPSSTPARTPTGSPGSSMIRRAGTIRRRVSS